MGAPNWTVMVARGCAGLEDQDRKQLFSVQVWEVVRQKPPVRGGCEEEGKEVEEEEDKEEERGKEEEEDEKETPVRLSCDALLPLGGRAAAGTLTHLLCFGG